MVRFNPQSGTRQYRKLPLSHIRVNWSLDHNPSYIGAGLIADSNNILSANAKKRYAERRKDCLWWEATSNTMENTKKVVRVWHNKRLRKAIIEALRTRGFDRDGRVLDTPYSERPAKPLMGSMQICCLSSIIGAPDAEVDKEAGIVIDGFISMSQEDVLSLRSGFRKL